MKSSLSIFRILRNLLKELDVPFTDGKLKALISEQTHQTYITWIGEVLCDLNVDSKVYRLEYDELLQLECPLILHLKGNEERFVVVSAFEEKRVKYYDPIAGKYLYSPRESFLSEWTGVVIVPFTEEHSGDPEYAKNKKKERQDKFIAIGKYIGLAFCFILLTVQILTEHPENFATWLPFILLKIAALFVISNILKIEIGESNSLINKICKSTDCAQVLTSKASKIFSWLSMGDMGAIYFGFGVLLLCIVPFIDHPTPILYLLFFLNVFSLPYTFFSISYQKFVVKKWCPFCLSIMGILWLEFFLGLTVPWTKFLPLGSSSVFLFVFVGILIATVWMAIKALSADAMKSKQMNTLITTIKKDHRVFQAMLAIGNTIPELHIPTEITMGNLDAQNRLTVVISPSCPSCILLYKEIRDYVAQHPEKLQVTVRFKTKSEGDNWSRQVIETIMEFRINDRQDEALRLFEGWANMEIRDIRKWEKQFNVSANIISEKAKGISDAYNEWASLEDIPGVPFMLFNSRIIPFYYKFDDVKKILKRM
jgi:uncharacterized membrane protein